MNETTLRIIALSDEQTSSPEIAELVGVSAGYIRKLRKRLGLPRPACGARNGEKNHQFVSGRRIDPDGYVLVTAPKDHPYARNRTNRDTKLIFEHRLVLEKTLGRYLLPEEIVDHIDGLTLHNSPENLRIFSSNGEHLRETTSGQKHLICASGRKNISVWGDHGEVTQRYDTYRLRRGSGDVRLQQILLAALSLGIDSPYLLGTHYFLAKAGIDPSSRSNLELALADVSHRWALLLAL